MVSLALIIRALAFLLVFGTLAGFAAYTGHVSALAAPLQLRADAIIVLTGGEGRTQAAIDLLSDDRGQRLLISGVHPDVSQEALRATGDFDADLFSCCIDLGREATDTEGNAREARDWVTSNGFTRVIIVTSDYHIPRSILELRAAMPEAELIAYPVESPRPWESATAARRWALEYLKFSAVFVREMARGNLEGE